MATNIFIIKTVLQGVKLLTIDDLESKKFSLKLLFEAEEGEYGNFSDSLQLQITHSDIVIAATQNIYVNRRHLKRKLKVMKVSSLIRK